jgi:hypothetical protein
MAPPGTFFQIYIQGILVWCGQDLKATVTPPVSGTVEIRIGSVADNEYLTDFSGSFSPLANRAFLQWTGGAFEGSNLEGFRIYSGTTPGGAVNYARPVATIVAFEQGDDSEGFGNGTFGGGGFGDANTFTWQSGPLRGGTWNYAIVPFSQAGNEGTPALTSVNIVAPPLPPARDAQGNRLEYSYSLGTQKVTLNWLEGN